MVAAKADKRSAQVGSPTAKKKRRGDVGRRGAASSGATSSANPTAQGAKGNLFVKERKRKDENEGRVAALPPPPSSSSSSHPQPPRRDSSVSSSDSDTSSRRVDRNSGDTLSVCRELDDRFEGLLNLARQVETSPEVLKAISKLGRTVSRANTVLLATANTREDATAVVQMIGRLTTGKLMLASREDSYLSSSTLTWVCSEANKSLTESLRIDARTRRLAELEVDYDWDSRCFRVLHRATGNQVGTWHFNFGELDKWK